MTEASYLQISGLTHRYPDFYLEPISLEVKAGETLVIVGESGSGKSTFLRLLAGFEQAEGGDIFLSGRQLCHKGSQIPPEARGIGMVFQDYALFPHLKIKANIAFGLKGKSRRQKTERVGEMLHFVGLESYGERYPHELSGGEQQRIALARALAPQPDLLLFDEPFSNLDAVIHHEVRSELQTLLEKAGTTTVFVTHDISDALVLADRMLVMRKGKVMQIGSPDELKSTPADPYVAQLLELDTHLHSLPDDPGAITVRGQVVFRQETPEGEEITLMIKK
ncbi:MAG: ABC transporter ATP-binding protein [Bacteroidota bacterium]